MIRFKNKVISDIVVSTALGYSGRGIWQYRVWSKNYRKLVDLIKNSATTVFTKSATRYERVGNVREWNPYTWFKYIRRLLDQGMLNAYGLTNTGVVACASEMADSCGVGFRVIPNFYPEFTKGYLVAAKEAFEAVEKYKFRISSLYFWALELNFSCPNSKEKIGENIKEIINCVRTVKQRYPDLFLIVKISYHHPYELAEELEKVNIDAIHAVNTIRYNEIYYGKSPLHKVGGGGVSGGPAFNKAYGYNKELRKHVDLPLIMGCGVTDRTDVRRYFEIGANCVSVCTAALRNPKETMEIIRRYN